MQTIKENRGDLINRKVDFKRQKIKRNKEDHYIR